MKKIIFLSLIFISHYGFSQVDTAAYLNSGTPNYYGEGRINDPSSFVTIFYSNPTSKKKAKYICEIHQSYNTLTIEEKKKFFKDMKEWMIWQEKSLK